LLRDSRAVQSELLVLRFQRGRREAFQELVRLWERPLFYYARRLVETEADAWDVLQQTWINVLKSIASFRTPENAVPWLYAIARNTVATHWRARHRQVDFQEERAELSEVAEESELPRFEDAEYVHQGLGRISLPHREVLTLFFLQDLSLDQMAEVLGVPKGTVKSRLHYAKLALRAALETGEGSHE